MPDSPHRQRPEPQARARQAAGPREGAPLVLRIVVLGLAGVVTASLGALAAAHLHPGLISATPTVPGASATQRHHSSSTTTTTTTAVPVLRPGAPPVLVSLEPATGHAGEQVVVVGSGLVSANGIITATFSGTETGVRCPSEQRCIVTVPPLRKGTTAASVQIATSSGVSNSRIFTYR